MATDLVIKEIQRFLASSEAQVLCIKGRWGIGKTFTWRTYLAEAQANRKLPQQDYAYVSMFGLNSLDDLRFAVLESTVPTEKALTGPDAETFGRLLDEAKSFGRRTRKYLPAALSTIGWGEVGNAIARSAFLLVRNQLICLDDLERAGKGLEPRDVLGLISFLKEERHCRVVLLLNDEALPKKHRKDFDRLLEKVVDTSLVFSPTPAEAASIAITENEPVGEILRHGITTLGITNIRVIKKIERLAQRLSVLLQAYRPDVLSQAVKSCLLYGWAVFEPDRAPPTAFVRRYNAMIGVIPRGDGKDVDPNEVTWREAFGALPFSFADTFDQIIFDGMEVGYFDEKRLAEGATELDERLARSSRDNSFAKAWDLYHGSLRTNDNEVLDSLYSGAMENLRIIDSMNINGAIRLLRELGREGQANELARAYTAVQPDNPTFYDLRNHMFTDESPIDPALQAAFEERLASFKDERDPLDLLLAVYGGQPWNDEDLRLLEGVSADDFESLFEGLDGPNLRRVVWTALKIGRLHTADHPGILLAVSDALTRSAAKSPMNRRRLRSWGFEPPDPTS